MYTSSFVSAAVAVLSLPLIYGADAKNILLTNDDGWAVAQIRAQFDELVSAGHDVVLSAPAQDKSGTGSDTTTPTVLTIECEYDTCPVGSPAEGFNASQPRLNYVNGYPVDAARYGIQTLAPKFWDGAKPAFVVSGPNIGNNAGSTTQISGTVGAACEAALEGLPATAFSGDSGDHVSYTTLTSEPNATSTESSWVYGALTVYFTNTILSTDLFDFIPLLPSGVIVNVNYPSIASCSEPEDYKWVFSRNLAGTEGTDIYTCGSLTLPAETDVIDADGCFASVSVINATTKTDVDALTQAEVYVRLLGLPFSCLD